MDVFSITEVAEMLGVSRWTIHREILRGKLGTMPVGGRKKVTRGDLERYLGKDRAEEVIRAFREDGGV